MEMFLHNVNGDPVTIHMEQAGDQVLTIGEYRYRPARMAKRIRQLAIKLWQGYVDGQILQSRLCFESPDTAYDWKYEGDGGCFTTTNGAAVRLGKWDEGITIGIAMHELAHEMHLRSGKYDESEDTMREAVALLVEREVGLVRTFEHEPYYTASNLVEQLCEMWAFNNQPFQRRWSEFIAITTDVDLADLVNYYLDQNEGLGLDHWLRRYNTKLDVREDILSALAECSLRYSLNYRRSIIRNLVRCSLQTPLDQLLQVFEAILNLDERHPDHDIRDIIDFCFAPVNRQRKGLLALVVGS